MKCFRIFGIIWLCIFLAACAGQKGQKKSPETFLAGIKQLKKGTAWYQKGCYQRALKDFLIAHEHFTAADNQNGVAMSLNSLGNVYRHIGDLDSAILFFKESVRIYIRLDDQIGQVRALSNQAAALIDGHKYQEAAVILNKAFVIAAHTQVTPVILLSNQGILLTKQKKYEKADKILQTALAKVISDNSDEIENSGQVATLYFALGNLNLARKNYQAALGFFQKALTLDQAAEFFLGIASDLAALGTTSVALSKPESAMDFLTRSAKIYALLGNQEKLSQVMAEFEKLAANSKGDIKINLDITRHFVKQWQTGKIITEPCR